MANDSGSQLWWETLLEVGKWSLAAAGTAVTVVGGWLLKMYGRDRARLNRHEERLTQADKEFGVLKEFRIVADKGPIGEPLARELERLKAEDERLHRRISKRDRVVNELKTSMARTETNVEWIVEELKRRREHE